MTELTLQVRPDGIFNDQGRVCSADFVDPRTAAAIARRIAAFHAGAGISTVIDRAPDEFVDLYRLLGIPDAGAFDAYKCWANNRKGPPWGKGTTKLEWGFDWLRFPVGVDMTTGETVWLDFKEPQEFSGGGHVMVMVGTSGAGKTIALTTICLSAALTHHPDDLIIGAFDFKGSSLVTNIRGLPHNVAAMASLADDRLWIPRMRDVIEGELDRRFALLDRVGVTELAEYEYLRRHKGEKLEKIPYWLLIIDEFKRLFKMYPDAYEFLDQICSQGRSAGLRMVLGSQELVPEVNKLLPNIPQKVCLRTLEASGDSYTLLGNREAEYLPIAPPGAAIIRNDRGRSRVQFAFPGQPYMPAQSMKPEHVHDDPSYWAPKEFTLTPMPEIPVREIAILPPLPEIIDPETGRAVTQIQATIKALDKLNLPKPEPKWLPPLKPLPVDELVRRLLGHAWDADYGSAIRRLPEIRFITGIKDIPRKHRQLVDAPVMSGNHVIVGRKEAGKTVAATTLVCSAALMYTPEQVQFFVIACSPGHLDLVARLPHVGGFAHEFDPLRIERMLAQALELIAFREEDFPKLGLMTMQQFRVRKFMDAKGDVPADKFGDMYVLIDGYPVFAELFPHLVPKVERIAQKGPSRGVHLILSTNGWAGGAINTPGFRGQFSTNTELRLAPENDYYNINNTKVAEQVPFGSIDLHVDDDSTAGELEQTISKKIRGRGTSMDGFHMQVGLPQMNDGTDVAAAVNAKVAPSDATRVLVLPTSIRFDDVLTQWEPTPGLFPFGISEAGLAPAVLDFAASPHLLVTGRAECGMSTTLRTIAASVMQFRDPQQARIYVLDPEKNLLCAVEEGPYLGRYEFEETAIRETCAQIAAELQSRKPDRKLTQRELAVAIHDWSGPEIFVLVDREEVLSSWDTGQVTYSDDGLTRYVAGHPLEPLLPYIGSARQVGFHLVVAKNIAGLYYSQGNPVIKELLKSRAPAIIMDGDPTEGFAWNNVKAVRSDPGRGIYTTDRTTMSVQIALSESAAR